MDGTGMTLNELRIQSWWRGKGEDPTQKAFNCVPQVQLIRLPSDRMPLRGVRQGLVGESIDGGTIAGGASMCCHEQGRGNPVFVAPASPHGSEAVCVSLRSAVLSKPPQE